MGYNLILYFFSITFLAIFFPGCNFLFGLGGEEPASGKWQKVATSFKQVTFVKNGIKKIIKPSGFSNIATYF